MTTADKVRAMTDEEFRRRAWALLTNAPECGGCSKGAMPIARRRFRQLGGRMFLALWSEEEDYRVFTRKSWGIIWPGETPPDADLVETGISLSACAAQLGGGDPKSGWLTYWKH